MAVARSRRVWGEVPFHSPVNTPTVVLAIMVIASRSAKPTDVPYLPTMVAPTP